MTTSMTFKRSVRLLATTALGLCLAAGAARAELDTVEHTPARTFAGAFLAGDVARNDNDFAAAALYYAEALQFDPDNELIERELLVALLTDGQFDKAVPMAERLKDSPEVERIAHLVLAVDAIRSDALDKAMEHLDSNALSDLERLMEGIIDAWVLHAKGDTPQALEHIDALDGQDWFNLFKTYHSGLIAQADGSEDLAAEYFDEALNNRAGGGASPLTYLRIAAAKARISARRGDFEQARADIDMGLTLAPTNPALVQLRENIEDPAFAETKITDLKTGSAEILLNLGSAINRDGAETFAALYLELARALTPDGDNVLFELGSIAERLDQPVKAIEYYGLVSDASPLKRIAALQQGLSLAALDRTEEAIETLKELVAANPSDYRGYLALGGVYAQEEDFASAVTVYEQALENIDNDEPTYWPLHYRMGIAYERTKQWPLAEARFKKTLELSPDQPDVLNYLGYSWIDMNMNLEEGLEMVRKAAELRPRSGYIIDSLGWAYYRLGRFEEAVEQLERAVDLLPRDPTINDHLGDAYWRVGRKLEASYQWSTTLDFDPEEELLAQLQAKIDAANTVGATPAIAVAITDDPAAAKQAAGGDGASEGDDG